MISTRHGLDVPTETRSRFEEQAIAAAIGASTYAIVTIIGGETVELLTLCTASERKNWRDLLGLNLAEDIDAQWGMAWVNPDGSVQFAGPNLVFAKRASEIVRRYHFDTNLRLNVENDTAHRTPFSFYGEDEHGTIVEDREVLMHERPGVLELHGFDLGSNPWGMAWQPYTLPHANPGEKPEPEFHSVLAVVGNDTVAAYEAFMDLALCD